MPTRSPFRSATLRTVLGLWLLFASVYGLASGGRVISVDEVAIFQVTRHFAWWDEGTVAPSIVTVTAPDGRHWGMNGPIISLLAVPLYAVGTGLDQVLPEDWKIALRGRRIENDAGLLWSGDIHLFAVSFFNSFVTAAAMALFFLLCARMGLSRRGSLIATFILGFSTLFAGHAKHLLTHPLITVFLLVGFIGLVEDQRRGDRRYLALAGAGVGGILLTRLAEGIVLPWIGLFILFCHPTDRDWLRRALWFGMPVALAFAAVGLFNWIRFGDITNVAYGHPGGFDTPLLVGLYGQLFSVGRSVFLYSPPLVLALFAWPAFMRRHPEDRALQRLILAIALSFLIMYSLWFSWFGGWGFGNRFLMPLLPLFLLALPDAIDEATRKRRLGWIGAALFCVAAGVFIQVLGISIHIQSAYDEYNLAEFKRLFLPAGGQLAAHWHALSHGRLLDFWLLRVGQQIGPGWALLAALPGLIGLTTGILLIRSAPEDPLERQA